MPYPVKPVYQTPRSGYPGSPTVPVPPTDVYQQPSPGAPAIDLDGLKRFLEGTSYQVDPNDFQFNNGPQDQTRGQQSMLSQMLFNQANGQGVNLAGQQERMATDRNIAQAYAMAQSNPNDAGAARNAANSVAAANQNAAAQSAQLAMQHQLGAQSQLGGMLGAQRGQDISAATTELQGHTARQQVQREAFDHAQTASKDFWGNVLKAGATVAALADGGVVPQSPMFAMPQQFAATGGQVPGQARFAGNSLGNDFISARLSPGEIVLPRSVTEDPDAAEKARLFVEAIQGRPRASKKGA